jgi:hypothetical protein
MIPGNTEIGAKRLQAQLQEFAVTITTSSQIWSRCISTNSAYVENVDLVIWNMPIGNV